MKGVVLGAIFLLVVAGLGFDPLGMIRYEEVVLPGQYFTVHINLINTGNVNLDNVVVTGYMPELNLYAKVHKFDIGNNEKTGNYLEFDIPKNTNAGLYLMIISARNQNDVNFRTNAARYVFIR